MISSTWWVGNWHFFHMSQINVGERLHEKEIIIISYIWKTFFYYCVHELKNRLNAPIQMQWNWTTETTKNTTQKGKALFYGMCTYVVLYNKQPMKCTIATDLIFIFIITWHTIDILFFRYFLFCLMHWNNVEIYFCSRRVCVLVWGWCIIFLVKNSLEIS